MRYFGTDGIRGPVGGSLIRPSAFFLFGIATARYLSASLPPYYLPRICIGRDTRASGPLLVQAFLRGFLRVFSVIPVNLGICPTPVVAWMTASRHYDLGVVVTASHNPATDNGIKFFLSGGRKATDREEACWSAIIDECCQDIGLCAEAERLPLTVWPDRSELYYCPYAQFCDSICDPAVFREQPIVIDCAHGAFVPFLKQYCAPHQLCHAEPDGMNINRGVGSLYADQLYAVMQKKQAKYGFALDGDGDRVMMVDHSGHVWDGDYMMLCLAHDQKQRGVLTGIVGTVMTNLAVESYIERYLSVPFMRVDVGDKHVSSAMRYSGASLGAESSGHIFSSADHHVSGDGFFSLLLFLRTLSCFPTFWPLVRTHLQRYPTYHLSVSLSAIGDWSMTPAVSDCLLTCKEILAGRGRIVIRPSGTEAVLRVLIEAQTTDLVNRCRIQLENVFRQGRLS